MRHVAGGGFGGHFLIGENVLEFGRREEFVLIAPRCLVHQKSIGFKHHVPSCCFRGFILERARREGANRTRTRGMNSMFFQSESPYRKCMHIMVIKHFCNAEPISLFIPENPCSLLEVKHYNKWFESGGLWPRRPL